MTASIHQNEFGFVEEAKKAFESNARLETYMNANEDLIALRCGPDRDCINIYQLGREVLFAHNVMNAAPELVVETERKNFTELPEEILTIYKNHAARPSIQPAWNEGVMEGIRITLRHLGIEIKGVSY